VQRSHPGLLGVALAVTLAAAAPAAADRVADVEDAAVTAAPAERDFWDWLLAPNAADISMILAKVSELRGRVASFQTYDGNGLYSASNAQGRHLALADAAGMLRYGLRLAPKNLELRRELALVLADAGDPGAEAALRDYIAAETPDRLLGDVRVELALILARQGDYDAATSHLRMALGSGFADLRLRGTGIILLAELYMQTHRMAEAIDLLSSATQPAQAGYGYLSAADLQIRFALAVAYDRDEQLSQAHAVLDQLSVAGADQLLYVLVDASQNSVPFVPLGEAPYFAALRDEALGHLSEARLEWLRYASDTAAPFRRRARDHVRAIDALLDQRAADARHGRHKNRKESHVRPPPMP
jgi:tetratricopeptide (TPR) repeat protein